VQLRRYISEVAATFDRSEGMRSAAQQLLRRASVELHDFAPLGFKIQGSGGAGVPATIPWVGFLDPEETTSPHEGLYVVYLFSADLRAVYLALIQGITRLHKQIRPPAAARERLRADGARIRDELGPDRLAGWAASIELGDSRRLPAGYEAGTVAARRYDIGALPPEKRLRADLSRMFELYQDAVAAKRQLLTTKPGSIATPSAGPVRADQDVLDYFKPKSAADYTAQVGGGRFTRTRRHEALIRDYGRWARARGFRASTAEHPKDLVLRQVNREREWLIEGKVVRRGNAAHAVREAVGQLLEYRRFLYVDKRKPPPELVALFTEPVGDAFVAMLDELGIQAVWNETGMWAGSPMAVDQGLAESGPGPSQPIT
jgi:MrcB-like, N-terminal domain